MSHHHFVLVTGGVLWDNHPEIRSNKSKWEMFAQADYDVTQAHGHFPKWLIYQFWFKILNVAPNIFRTDYTKVLLQKRTGTSSWEKVAKYETDAEGWVTNSTPDGVSVDKVWWPDINTSVKKTYYSSTEDRRVNGSRFLVRYRMWSIYGGMRGYWKCKLAMPRTRAAAKDADERSGGWLGPTED